MQTALRLILPEGFLTDSSYYPEWANFVTIQGIRWEQLYCWDIRSKRSYHNE